LRLKLSFGRLEVALKHIPNFSMHSAVNVELQCVGETFACCIPFPNEGNGYFADLLEQLDRIDLKPLGDSLPFPTCYAT
jgi:hypothetical protein